MKEIPLTRGKVALVDDEDYERVLQLKWCVSHIKNSFWYAVSSPGKHDHIYMHRFILDCPPEKWVDHINHDGLDNRRINLRFCTRTQNNHNRRKQAGITASRFKGVTWRRNRKRWVATIRNNGPRLYLGYFHSEEDAARAYDAAARKFHGDFAYQNLANLAAIKEARAA